MKMQINKIPSVLKNVPLGRSVNISDNIPAKEGTIIMVEAGVDEGKLNVVDYRGGKLGKLWHHDKIPAVLGFRKALTEFAGVVPKKVEVGDELYLLCESGVVGEISGVFESWGRPMKVKVLGSILDAKNKPMNLKDYKLDFDNKKDKQAPLIIFLGTRMDSGKTTMACKIGHNFNLSGKNVGGVKVTGVAFSQDLMKLQDAGVNRVYDFVDMGLPSTCNGNSKEVIDSALKLVTLANTKNPDCILVEFGDAVLGEYHVADILQNKIFHSQIAAVILCANDLAGIAGTIQILAKWEIKVDLITGPVANSKIGVNLINKYFQIPAESNQHEIYKTVELLQNKIFKNKS